MLELILFAYGIVLCQGKTHRRLSEEPASDTNQSNFDFEAFFSDWRSMAEINGALKALYLHGSQYTAHISLYSIGKSAEGRPINVLSLGKSALEVSALSKKRKLKKTFVWKETFASPFDDAERNEIAVLGTLHGREWSAASSVLFSCWQSIKTLAEDPSAFFDTTYHFLPVMNPDGLEYTFERRVSKEQTAEFSSMGALNGRLWRKNRRNLCSRKMRGHKCAHGIDLNRNFGVADVSWGFGNPKPTTEVFQGKRPFSEPESKRMGQWMAVVGKRLKAVIDVHCCSSALLPSFFYKDGLEAVAAEAQEVCEAVASDIGEQYPCKARESSFSESNTGIFADWLANEVQVPFVFILETRGNSESRKMEKIFLVPKEDITSIGSEVHRALLSVKRHVFKPLPEESEAVEATEEAEVEANAEQRAEEELEDLERLFKELESGAQSVTELDSVDLGFGDFIEAESEPEAPVEEAAVKIASDEVFGWEGKRVETEIEQRGGELVWLTVLLLVTAALASLLLCSRSLRRKKRAKKHLNKII